MALLLTLALGAALTVLFQLAVHPVLLLVRTPDALLSGALAYLRWTLGGLVVTFLYNAAASLLRAVGDNPTLVTSLAKDGGMVKIQGLAIANAFVALSGCIMGQYQRFFEISMGTGAIVIGLASVIIGTNVFRNFTLMRATTAVIVGSILYKACVALALSLGLSPQDMKLVTAVLFLLILALGEIRRKKVKARA